MFPQNPLRSLRPRRSFRKSASIYPRSAPANNTTFPLFSLLHHYQHLIFIVFTTNTTFSLFYRHYHRQHHISIVFTPPTSHFYCFHVKTTTANITFQLFSSTTTFLLFSRHRSHFHCFYPATNNQHQHCISIVLTDNIKTSYGQVKAQLYQQRLNLYIL